jgi:anionic cell wall polymer biosynthesis LytR-Cps2A-Psr (LCP) family protein
MLILLNPVLSLPGRNAVAADGELETQREVVTSMLLRCLDHPEVITTLSLIMQWTRNAAGTRVGMEILMNFFFKFSPKLN